MGAGCGFGGKVGVVPGDGVKDRRRVLRVWSVNVACALQLTASCGDQLNARSPP